MTVSYHKLKKYNNSIFFILLYITLIFGFVTGEDSTGGAFKDYSNQKQIVQDFSDNFHQAFFNYDSYTTRHSPVLIIILSIFEKFNIDDLPLRLIFLHFSLLLVIFLYKCIRLKFPEQKKEVIFILSSLIFLSPSFRSLSIWPDSRIFGLIFFTLSIYFFLKFQKKKKYNDVIKCIISYTISSYLSPNFAIFAIFYTLNFYNEIGLNKKFLFVILINLIFSLPAFIYIFSLESVFLFKSGVPVDAFDVNEIFNISNKILLISSLIFFYAIPFIFTKSIKVKLFSIKNILIAIFIVILLSYFFSYDVTYTGGGIFFKLSSILFNNNILFFVISIFCVAFILELIKDKNNLLLVLLIYLNNPQITIYHKYYDPLLFVMLLTIFKLNIQEENLFKKNSLIFFYFFSSSFLLLSYFK